MNLNPSNPTPHPLQPGLELVIPNPKLKLMDQVREVLCVSAITRSCYCDWIRRYIRFHKMRSREELLPGAGKVEQFLSDLAVKGRVSTCSIDPTSSRRAPENSPSSLSHPQSLTVVLQATGTKLRAMPLRLPEV